MSSYYFIKLYNEILSDPKMGRLPDRLWRRAVELFLLANDAESRDGTLPTLTDMAWTLRSTEEELTQELETLSEAGIVELRDRRWFVTNFAKRQAPVSDRERKQRQRERDSSSHEPVTNRDTCKNIELELELELDTEQESSPPSAEIAAAPPPQKTPPKRKAPEETTLPDTPEARIMFAKLAANARDRGRRAPMRFGSLEQKRKFIEAAARLDGQFEYALDAGLGNGITAVGKLVNYLASPKWQEEPQRQAARGLPTGKTEPAGFQGIRDWLEEVGSEQPG